MFTLVVQLYRLFFLWTNKKIIHLVLVRLAFIVIFNTKPKDTKKKHKDMVTT